MGIFTLPTGLLRKLQHNPPSTEEWLRTVDAANSGPADWVDRLEKSLSPFDEVELLGAIRAALARSLAEVPEKARAERDDRLPLARAAKEKRFRDQTPTAFMTNVFESLGFGQHVIGPLAVGLPMRAVTARRY